MKTLNELKTSRQTWNNVALYTSAEEATARGFALMYEDERGSVYGIRNAEAVAAGNFGKWDKVAFVPGSEYMKEYAAQAVEDMPTVEEIAYQRAENAQAIKAKQEESKNTRAEWEAMSTDSETTYLLNTPAKKRISIMRKWEAIDKDIIRLKNISLILRHNYRVALAARVLPAFVEILKKYNGKKAGEKTLAKFRDELTKAASVSIYFERGILSQKSTHASIYEIIDGFRGGETIDIYTKSDAEFINDNNEFCAPCLSDLQPLYLSYIDNPEKRLNEIEQAAAEVKRIAAEYNAAADAYNALTVDGFEHIRRI